MSAHVLRLLRPLLVAGTVCLLAAGAHVLGGGTLPAAETSTALIALVLATVAFVSGRQLSWGRIAAVLGIGQVLLHGALSLLPSETACVPSLAGTGHHTVQAGACLMQAPEPLVEAAPGLAMSLAHLLAAAATAAAVSWAEAAIWRLAAWFHPLVHALQPVTIVPRGRARVGSTSVPLPSPRRHRADEIRGPPEPGIPLVWPV